MFNTCRRYERELVLEAEMFYTVSLRNLGLDDCGSLRLAAAPSPSMRWGETIPDLRVEGAIPPEWLDDVVPVGLGVSGGQIVLMLEDAVTRQRCDRQILLGDSPGATTTVTLSVPNSAASGDITEVELRSTGRTWGTRVIIQERRAGKLLTETRLVCSRSRERKKSYLEITEFGSL